MVKLEEASSWIQKQKLSNFKRFNNMLSKFEKINLQNKIWEKLKIWQLDKGRKYEGFPGGASGKEPSCQCR